MILHLTKDELEWQSINHHEEFHGSDSVVTMLQAEFFYYKNDDITIRSTVNIIEHNNNYKNFEVYIHSYTHIHPHGISMEFADRKQLGEFETLEKAKHEAQIHINHHRINRGHLH